MATTVADISHDIITLAAPPHGAEGRQRHARFRYRSLRIDGSATVDDVLAAGHEVTGLARSTLPPPPSRPRGRASAAATSTTARASVLVLRPPKPAIDLANKHDWSYLAASIVAERAAVQTIGDALAGTTPFPLASASPC